MDFFEGLFMEMIVIANDWKQPKYQQKLRILQL